MLFLFLIVILFFIVIIGLHSNKIIEGLENSSDSSDSSESTTSGNYQSYNNNPAILAQTNAANIQYLKQRLDDLKKVEDDIQTLNKNVNVNTTSLKQLSQISASKAQQLTGISPSASISSIPTLAQAGKATSPPPPPPMPQTTPLPTKTPSSS